MKRIRIQHTTSYRYSEPVTLLPHKLMLRPRAGHDIQLERSSLRDHAKPHDQVAS